jgi:hypothetical protein
MKKRQGLIIATVLATAAIARAQPQPGDPAQPGGDTGGSGAQIGSNAPPPPPPVDPPLTNGDIGPDPYAPTTGIPELPKRKALPHGPIGMPEVLTTPTGWLLPAAVLYSRTSLDTGGGVTSDTRVGLGDVAEFGIATTDAVRERDDDGDARASRIQPYVTASFRLGVSENRLFEGMPGMTLGFRKSFERNHDGYKTRIAELTLVASKHIGKNTALHLGGAFWDASVFGLLSDGSASRSEFAFHDGNVANQIRAFGGIEVRPLPKSQILVDLGWSPEFCYRCTANEDKIKLRPTLSWGVRYAVADFMNLEAGVRVPDIGTANLLDAQIFGQVTFTSWALRRAVDSLK